MSSRPKKTALVTGGNKGIKNIAIYAMCPGWVQTDMGGNSAPRTPEQGADTAIWLATEGTMRDSGKFFRNRSEQRY